MTDQPCMLSLLFHPSPGVLEITLIIDKINIILEVMSDWLLEIMTDKTCGLEILSVDILSVHE